MMKEPAKHWSSKLSLITNNKKYKPFQHDELPTPFAMNGSAVSISASARGGLIWATKPLRNHILAAFKIFREIEQLWVIAEFLEDVDGLERL